MFYSTVALFKHKLWLNRREKKSNAQNQHQAERYGLGGDGTPFPDATYWCRCNVGDGTT
jgi:hypothetical protein